MSLLNDFKLKVIASAILALGVVSPAFALIVSQPPCFPGSYSLSGYGAYGSCTLASPGYYVPDYGATSQIPAPVGSYVSTTGATAPTLTSPGYYVNTIAATQPTIAPRGSYVSTSGATAPTLAAPGTYVSTLGATTATNAPAGSYVPTSGAIAPTLASKGYFVTNPGSVSQTAAPIGQYVNTIGAVVGSGCPDGSSSYGASVACRLGANLNAVPGVTVSPTFNLSVLGAVVENGQGWSQDIKISNDSTDLGFSNVLTDLTLLDGTFSGGNAAAFSLSGFTPGSVLHEGGLNGLLMSLLFDNTGLAAGDYATVLSFVTDQNNVFGTAGKVYNFTVNATVAPVPLPAAAWLLGSGLLGLIGVARRKAA